MKLMFELINIVCAIVMLLTAAARLNDIGTDKMSFVWQVRRIGLTLSGVAAMALVYFTLLGQAPGPWYTALVAGMTLTWVTTPNHPPWWKYISRGNYIEQNRRSTDA